MFGASFWRESINRLLETSNPAFGFAADDDNSEISISTSRISTSVQQQEAMGALSRMSSNGVEAEGQVVPLPSSEEMADVCESGRQLEGSESKPIGTPPISDDASMGIELQVIPNNQEPNDGETQNFNDVAVPLNSNMTTTRPPRRATSPILGHSRHEQSRSGARQPDRRVSSPNTLQSPTAGGLHSPPTLLFTGRRADNVEDDSSEPPPRPSRPSRNRRPPQRRSTIQAVREALNPDQNWKGRRGTMVAVRSRRSWYRRLCYSPRYRGRPGDKAGCAASGVGMCFIVLVVMGLIFARVFVMLRQASRSRDD